MDQLGLAAWHRDLREWQERLFGEYLAKNQQDFLVQATPGSGKTYAAIRLLHQLLASGAIDRVLIVAPFETVVMQWIDAAHDAGGIELDRVKNNDLLRNGISAMAREFHGASLTYGQATTPNGLRAFSEYVRHFRQRVAVVFDELHHAGRDHDWGKKLREVFGACAYRIILSGTPFRTDGSPLPFVSYDAQRQCVADFAYGYSDALRDGICRPVLFPKFEGQLEWWNGEDILRHTFSDPVTEEQAAQRLKTAITSEWLDTVIQEAEATLLSCRQQGHHDAAGLVVCMDQYHARKVAARVRSITGESPEIVISDDDESSMKLEVFKRDTKKWIVAVKMVSEGVDIKRLRVGVYATNVLTELYFRQFVGRFVRMIDALDSDQTAHIFIPSDDVIMTHAKHIRDEVIHTVNVDLEDIRETMRIAHDQWTEDALPGFDEIAMRLRSVHGKGIAIPDGVITIYGMDFSAEEYAQAKAEIPPAQHSDQTLYGYMLGERRGRMKGMAQAHREERQRPDEEATLARTREKQRLLARETRLLKTWQSLEEARGLHWDEQQHAAVRIALNKLVGVKEKRGCTVEELERRAAYINAQILTAEG